MSYGVHFTLKTEKEAISVHLGPSWYMEKQGMTFAPGDKVEVTGSRITYEGQPTIIAGEVKKGGQVLKLRMQPGSRPGPAGPAVIGPSTTKIGENQGRPG